MMFITFIKDCGFQSITAVVIVVQFLIIRYLRSRVQALEEYEFWYFNQAQSSQPSQPAPGARFGGRRPLRGSRSFR